MASQAATSMASIPDATKLALERTRMAHERTLMAWIRTGTSLISFGFTIYKFFQYLREKGEAESSERPFGPRQFALLMISIGLVALLLAGVQHWRYTKKLRERYLEATFSMATIVALMISGLGILALVAVIFRQ